MQKLVLTRGLYGDVTGEYNGVKTGRTLLKKRSQAELTKEAVELAKILIL